jgi:hypothetical protein
LAKKKIVSKKSKAVKTAKLKVLQAEVATMEQEIIDLREALLESSKLLDAAFESVEDVEELSPAQEKKLQKLHDSVMESKEVLQAKSNTLYERLEAEPEAFGEDSLIVDDMAMMGSVTELYQQYLQAVQAGATVLAFTREFDGSIAPVIYISGENEEGEQMILPFAKVLSVDESADLPMLKSSPSVRIESSCCGGGCGADRKKISVVND